MSDVRPTHAFYLRDLGCLVKEAALDVKRSKDGASADQRSYELGRLMAFHEVVSLMQQQALVFQIPLDEICLQDIDPERDLT